MCQPKSKGGQRCFSHALPAYQRAADRFNAVAIFEDEYAPRYDAAMKAGAELASTTKGLAYIRDMIAAGEERGARVDYLKAMEARGIALREANDAVRNAVNAHERQQRNRIGFRPPGHVLRIPTTPDERETEGSYRSVFIKTRKGVPADIAGHSTLSNDGIWVADASREWAAEHLPEDAIEALNLKRQTEDGPAAPATTEVS